MRTRNNGFSLVELLVTLSIVGIGLGLMSTLAKPSQRQLFANDAKAMFQQARFESIKRNVAMAVVWDESSKSLKMLANTANAMTCTATTVLQTKSVSDYRWISITNQLPGGSTKGIIWLPNSTIKGCDGNALSLWGHRFIVEDSRSDKQSTIQIMSGGRISLE
ncbi:MAG: prepilin-type N-terminal cleavage/methylation domain-containing protein [Trueperaceae bacterium]|nr:prepilin-type N-terminal cleavage/methylation domain-containing protein [Trueperaceae bacterium]